jgi:RimJ/RimL family protein N-acetyltransferase
MLVGKLVRLRPLEPADAERCYRWFNDEAVIGYLFSTRYPISMAHEERFLRERPPNDFSNVFLAIETNKGVQIGTTGFLDISAEGRRAGLAITIGEKEYWSKGYGTDAVATLIRFAFEEMGLHRVWLTTIEYNERAITCYRKVGFHEEARLRQHVFRHGRYWDVIEMGILRDEFDAMQNEGSTGDA